MNTTISIVVGDAVDVPIQCWTRGGAVSAVYAPGDTLSSAVYQSRATSPLFLPTAAWYTAMGTQTGYGQGQVVVSFTNAQTALMVPTLSYSLLVYRTLSANNTKTELIARVQLTIEAVAYP